jgi:hypothetical protein
MGMKSGMDEVAKAENPKFWHSISACQKSLRSLRALREFISETGFRAKDAKDAKGKS